MGLFGKKREVGELNDKVADMLEKGYNAYEKGDYATSGRKFRLALDFLLADYELSTQIYLTEYKVADLAEILNMNVQSYLNTGNYDEALSLIDQNSRRFKNRRRVLLMRANVFSAKGEASSELEVYNELLKLDKKDTTAYIRKAELLKKLKKADEKELRDILNKAAKNQKASDIVIAVNLARAYRTILGDHESSQYVLDRINTKQPSKERLVEQAEVHLHNKKVEEAVTCLEKALSLDQEYLEAFKTMVKAYKMEGNFQKARDICERGLRIEPSNPVLQVHYKELSGDSGIMRKVKNESTYM